MKNPSDANTRNHTAFIVNAFIQEDGSGGNPAGVVLDADPLTSTAKQTLAAHLGLSETVFVSRSEIADYKMEFFTPLRQIPHCGHATVAAFCLLAEKGRLAKEGEYSKETTEGPRRVFLRRGEAHLEQSTPQYSELKNTTISAVLKALNLPGEKLLANSEPRIVSTANRMLIVPVCDEKTLGQMTPDMKAIKEISERNDLVGYYVFTLGGDKTGRKLFARMFAPRYGILEESATGTGAGAMACYLYDILGIQNTEMVVRQGMFMRPPSASKISVTLQISENKIQSVRTGGLSRLITEKRFEI